MNKRRRKKRLKKWLANMHKEACEVFTTADLKLRLDDPFAPSSTDQLDALRYWLHANHPLKVFRPDANFVWPVDPV